MTRALAILLIASTVVNGGCTTSDTARRPSAARLAGVSRLAVVVQGDSRFEVMAARLKASAVNVVPPVPGGGGFGNLAPVFLVLALATASLAATASIQGAAASEDATAATALKPHVDEPVLRDVTIDSFARTLRSGGRFEVEVLVREPTSEERQRFDAVVFLRFPAWGFLLLRTDDPSLAAFVDVEARMALARRGDSLWEQEEIVLGHGRQTMEELEADPELVRRELSDALETAGFRLAAELLYPRGEP
jgi:hypothetical protein